MKMSIEEVNAQTDVALYPYRADFTKRVAVHAVMPCGVDGPWIGELVLDITQDDGRAEDDAKFWIILPVRESNQYRLHATSAGRVRGKMAAALALRDYIASRSA